ncbi:MAG: TIM barrel protein [Patescibacteria group bacterium]
MKFGLASLSLFPLSPKKVMQLGSQAGFDFVEIFLFRPVDYGCISALSELSGKLDIELHFHQVWSTQEERDKSWRVRALNAFLTGIGWIPKGDYRLSQWVPHNAWPVVVYADRWQEAAKTKNMWMQTISTNGNDGATFKCSWQEFRGIAAEKKLPLVFDTMHFLEWLHEVPDIHLLESGFRRTERIRDDWEKFWCQFYPQVKEIHWNDFDPGLPRGRARNLWPGEGIGPLRELAEDIKATHWDGCVVPEIQPRLPFPYGRKELLALRKKMDEYFG